MEGNAIWFGNVGNAEGRVFVGEHLAYLAACLGAGVVGAEDATRIAGGELTYRSAEFAV